jgi:hypothetical protein
MAKKRSPHHRAALPGANEDMDPAAKYNLITGRNAADDALPGKLLAGLPYLNRWLSAACGGVLDDMDVGYRPTLASLGPGEIPPLPDWVRSAALLWAQYATRTGLSKEKHRQIGLPSLPILLDILATPPLRLSLSCFALARGLYRAGQAVVRGELAPGLSEIVAEPVRRMVRLGCISRPEIAHEYESGDIPLSLFLYLADITRETIAEVRQAKERQHSPAGPARDFVARAFHEATVQHRLPAITNATHLALLEAVAGIEAISTQEQLSQAIRKWSNRMKRFAGIGPLLPHPKVPADLSAGVDVHEKKARDTDR